jgi:hypothetical protein
MLITYKLVDPKGEVLASADTIGYLDGLVAHLPPGRYTVDEIRDEPGPIGVVRTRWGAIRRFEDGTVLLEPDPW